MHDGAVVFVSGYGIEAFAHIQILLRTQFMQLLVDADFRLAACGDGLFQPFQKFHQGHAVALHGGTYPDDFLLVADGLQQCDG